jgi:Putative stress-induced transcription regulator
MASNPAPGELDLVRAFVNTWNGEDAVERLSNARALRDWLAERDLLDPGARVTVADHRHAIEVREALRALLLANAGLDLDPSAGRVLDAAARRAHLGVRFDPDGHVHTDP